MNPKPNIAETSLPSNARLSALIALVHTLDKGKPLDSAWAADRHFSSMSPSDKAFSQLLVKTVLRRLGQIDALIGQFLERPLSGKTSRIAHILRLGIAQLSWLETPPHAAVHSSVEMTKQIKMEKFGGLVNAVLKRVIKEGPDILAQQDAAKLNTPAWLWEAWEKAYGRENTEKIAQMHMNEPPLDISVKSSPDSWAENLGGTALPTGSVRLRGAKNITHLKGFSEGSWWVQDAAAALPAIIMGNVKDRLVVDMCAAPGGKTAQLLAAGAKVIAMDMSKERIALLKTNIHRLKFQAEYVNADAAKWKPDSAPDAILLDAPCSATGTLRRHPDVAWHRNPEDIGRLAATQHKLLRHALDILKPSGKLVYSVCSLQPEEGEEQITALLGERKDISLLPVNPAAIGGLNECLTARGEIRTLPFYLGETGGMDGFYAALLQKN
jgi:16S rRNA (cytosine967-C5)-methyltransferase